jgi:Flp pilus assembly pilin Flp
MRSIQQQLAALRADRRGITALEYGIMASWLAFIIIGAFVKFGAGISGIMGSVGGSL